MTITVSPEEAELAVVIVNFNTGGYLDRCLASLERHAGDIALDVLVIDNASHDGSHTTAVAAHPWARLIENPTNVYLSPAWNQGIRETSAPFVLLLNPDTEWWAGTLADLVEVAERNPRSGIVGPVVRNSDGTIYESGRLFPGMVDAFGHAILGSLRPGNRFTRRYHMDGWDRMTQREVDWVSGCCMLFPREVFDAVGTFDEGFPLYGEELDIASRLRDAGWSVLYTPRAEVVHESGVSTGRSREMLRMHSDSVYRYYRKHRAAGWRRLTLPVAWMTLRLRAELEALRGRITTR
ncbi:MAG TPA: glycosyltransferase family 2 protein [Actinomycetota bacterium]|nr:glycosyltransferase family 2 protein [Actinomycetota bacterium]